MSAHSIPVPIHLTRAFTLPPQETDFTKVAVRIVRVTNFGINNPERIYSEYGALFSKDGVTELDDAGEIDVWVAGGTTLRLELFSKASRYIYDKKLTFDLP
jgi:hypothetical protein